MPGPFGNAREKVGQRIVVRCLARLALETAEEPPQRVETSMPIHQEEFISMLSV